MGGFHQLVESVLTRWQSPRRTAVISAAQLLLVAQSRRVREASTAEGKTKAMGVAMFERFTDSARRILILATYAASTRQCE